MQAASAVNPCAVGREQVAGMVEARIVRDAARNAKLNAIHVARSAAVAAVEAAIANHLHRERQSGADGLRGGRGQKTFNFKGYHLAGAVFSEFGEELESALGRALREGLRERVVSLLAIVASISQAVVAEFDALARGDSGTGMVGDITTGKIRDAGYTAAGGFAKAYGRVCEVVVLAGFGGVRVHGVCCVVLCLWVPSKGENEGGDSVEKRGDGEAKSGLCQRANDRAEL